MAFGEVEKGFQRGVDVFKDVECRARLASAEEIEWKEKGATQVKNELRNELRYLIALTNRRSHQQAKQADMEIAMESGCFEGRGSGLWDCFAGL